METTKLSSKGQVVLPKSIRDELDWPVGADLTVERQDDSVVLRRRDGIRPTTIDEVSGMFKFDRPITNEEIEEAVEAELRARWRRKG
jgi:AbrB family looped-hinge helix DNA binding protein